MEGGRAGGIDTRMIMFGLLYRVGDAEAQVAGRILLKLSRCSAIQLIVGQWNMPGGAVTIIYIPVRRRSSELSYATTSES